MKVYQISLIIGLSMLLNLSTSIASINKKIAIIAAGSAVTAVGSTLWQTLRSYRGNIEVEFNGEPLNVDIHNANKFSGALSEKVFNKNLIERIKLKIINDIKRYTDNDKLANIKFIINKKDDTVSIETTRCIY